MGCFAPILPLFLISLDINIQNYSLLMVIRSLAMVLFESYFGILSDKIGREILVVTSFFSLSLLTIGYTFSSHLAFFFILQFMWGISSTALAPTFKTMVSNITLSRNVGAALGMYVTILTFGTIFGTLLGSYIAEIFGYLPVFYLISGVFFLAGLTISRSRNYACIKLNRWNFRLPQIPSIRIEPIMISLKSGIFEKKFLMIYLLTVIYTLGTGMVRMYIPIIAAEHFDASIIQVGMILTVQSAVKALITPFSGYLSDKFNRLGIIISGFSLYIILGFLSFGISNLNGLTLVVAGMALSNAMIHPTLLALLTDLVSRDLWGSIHGVHGTFQDIGVMISPIMASVAWIRFGPMSLFPIAGVVQILNLIIILWIRNIVK